MGRWGVGAGAIFASSFVACSSGETSLGSRSPSAPAQPSAEAGPATPPTSTPPPGSTPPQPDPPAACDVTNPGTTSPDPGPAPAEHLTYARAPAPAVDRQSARWVPTGAAGCEGLIPADVPARLSFTASSSADCRGDEPAIDGEGNLSFAFRRRFFGAGERAFFLSDGTPGQLVSGLGFLGTRPRGSFRTVHSEVAQWTIAVLPDGTDEALVRGDSDPRCKDFVYATYDLARDPRGGFLETRVRAEFNRDRSKFIHHYELRWVDEKLSPRTQWVVGTTWDYGYNIGASAYVDPRGNAFATPGESEPLSRRRLHADLINAQARDFGNTLPHCLTVGTDLRRLGDCRGPGHGNR